MLNQLQRWLDRFEINPEKTSLRSILPAINVLLVLLVVFAVSASAISLIRKLANEQGLTQVQLAVTSAREKLHPLNEDTLKQVRSLAGSTALRRAFQEKPEVLLEVLRQRCRAAGLDACALVQDQHVLVTTTDAVSTTDWASVLAAANEQGERFAVAASSQHAVMGAHIELDQELFISSEEAETATAEPSAESMELYALRLLDDRMETVLSQAIGMKVGLLNYKIFSEGKPDVYTRLNSNALSDGRYAAERINSRNEFVASAPVFASTGEAVVLVQTIISTDASDANARELINRMLLMAVLVAAIAIGVSLLLGQRVAKPVRALTNAARRLSQGDFSTSIPLGGPAEIGVLSRIMEDMRRNLVQLTGTLRRREAESQAVLTGTLEGVFAVDKSRNITYLNPQGARMLGITAEEAMGRFCGEVLKPCVDKLGHKPCEMRCPILQARTSHSAQAVEQLEINTGAARTVVITSAGMADGIQVQVMRDETELEAIRHARDAVLANISHEFRTPLAAQLASIELLLEGLDHLQPQQTRELVLSLERSTQRLTALIDNLLESVRIEAGQLSIRQQSVYLHEVTSEAQALVGSLLTQRGQTVLSEISDALPAVAGDEVRLVQVYVNLLANACKYAPEHSVVRLGATVQGNQLSAWVEDEGAGIPDHQSGSIFDRFSRGSAQEPEPNGLGLGLWIVKSIIERHGGQITVGRTANQRTRFSFTLPLYEMS